MMFLLDKCHTWAQAGGVTYHIRSPLVFLSIDGVDPVPDPLFNLVVAYWRLFWRLCDKYASPASVRERLRVY